MCDLCGPSDAATDHSIDHAFALDPDSVDKMCRCGEHLSKHPDKLEWLRKHETEIILKEGHQVRYIFPGRDSDPSDRPFAYSVGRTLFDRPELFVVGGLDYPIAAHIINEAAERDYAEPLMHGQYLEGVVNFPLKVIECDPEAADMSGALRIAAGKPFEAFQLLWPDPAGVYPDEPGYTTGLPQPMYPKVRT